MKDLEEFVYDLFGNLLELREANTRLLEFFAIRQREQGGIISTIGDGFLIAASEFRNLYPDYIGRFPRAEERWREQLANNPNFRLFVDVSVFLLIQSARLANFLSYRKLRELAVYEWNPNATWDFPLRN